MGHLMFDSLPSGLDPTPYLVSLSNEPTEWVVVWGHELSPGRSWGAASFLSDPEHVDEHLSSATWNGRSLGRSWVQREGDDCAFYDGLTEEWPVPAHLFINHRPHHGLTRPSFEFIPSFLWFLDAVPRSNGSWYYLTEAGAERELIRVSYGDDREVAEVAALPLRRYLAARKLVLVVQHDLVEFCEDEIAEPKERLVIQDALMYLEYDAQTADFNPQFESFFRLLGKHVITPLEIDPCKDTAFGEDEGPFPEFIYGMDPTTGSPLRWTCKEEKLSNYFVDRNAPHYLTPVYFTRDVLSRYTQQPSKYSVGKRGVSCLDLWSLRMDINPEGLVEVYLGDLGTYLPAEEREYWKKFNVPPSGGMSEERFKTDFLVEFVESNDPIAKLFEARYAVNKEFEDRCGRGLFLPLHEEDQKAYEGLHLMTTADPVERDRLVITLAKAVIDAMDASLLRDLVGKSDGRSLELLEELVVVWGGEPLLLVEPLRALQSLRSSGGAHIRGDNWGKAMVRAGIEGEPVDKQFEILVRNVGGALSGLATLVQESEPSPS